MTLAIVVARPAVAVAVVIIVVVVTGVAVFIVPTITVSGGGASKTVCCYIVAVAVRCPITVVVPSLAGRDFVAVPIRCATVVAFSALIVPRSLVLRWPFLSVDA